MKGPAIVAAGMIFCLSLFYSSYALAAPDRGLSITPLREYVQVAPGAAQTGMLRVTNNTSQPMSVTVAFEQFSVADYTYDYHFATPKEDWIRFQPGYVGLLPGKSQQVTYTITVPKKATPGGHYFTMVASTMLGEGREVRAATVTYVTVTGRLMQMGEISHEFVPSVVLYGDIPFKFDIKNTGNTHYFIYVSGKLSGPFTSHSSNEITHIVLPDAVRTVGDMAPAPLLPGVYKLTYGYRTENGQRMSRDAYVVYIPPWFWLLVTGGILVGVVLARRRTIRAYKH